MAALVSAEEAGCALPIRRFFCARSAKRMRCIMQGAMSPGCCGSTMPAPPLLALLLRGGDPGNASADAANPADAGQTHGPMLLAMLDEEIGPPIGTAQSYIETLPHLSCCPLRACARRSRRPLSLHEPRFHARRGGIADGRSRATPAIL